MEKRFVGFYNSSVILTYIGLSSSMLAIYLACDHNFRWAIFFLMISGLCDMFDGTVARMIKRSEQAKKFGIQIDSLCDLVCFGVTPAFIGLSLYCGASDRVIGLVAGIALVLAGVIRLAYFNVTEEERQSQTTERRKYYQGLPITNSSLAAPIGYIVGCLLTRATGEFILPYVYSGFLFLTAFLFVYNFKMPKTHGKANIVIIICALGLFAGVLLV